MNRICVECGEPFDGHFCTWCMNSEPVDDRAEMYALKPSRESRNPAPREIYRPSRYVVVMAVLAVLVLAGVHCHVKHEMRTGSVLMQPAAPVDSRSAGP